MATNEAGVGAKKTIRRKKDSNIVWFWGNDCKYEVITDKVDTLGWKIVDDQAKEAKCNIFWVDVSTIHERLRFVMPWQIVNHFPGMTNIARKNRMGQNLNKFQKQFPREFNFYPKTWVLPLELSDFRNQFDNTGKSLGGKVFILKPDTGCQGKGIFLTKSWDKVPTMDNWVAQVYMKKPLLIDGFKFDLRIYVFVTCVKPLRMYLFEDGLVRLCSEEYVKPTKENIHMTQMHLTNYAINKNNSNFHQPGEAQADDGSKRALTWFMDWIREDWGEAKADRLWKRIGNISVKTLLTILPTLSREYEQSYKSFNNVPLVRPRPPAKAVAAPSVEDSEAASVAVSNAAASDGIVEEHTELTAENLTAISEGPSAVVAGGQEDGEDGSEDELEEGVGGIHGSCAAKLEKTLMCRGSRCFEVLGLDIMIDSKLNPWMIEVNHLPSFGTDSPLDLDIKGRLMEEVFNCLPVLPDDEIAYNLHHKAEAEKRLTIERTTASITKMRDKATVEKERELKEVKEKQERIKKRRHRDAMAAAAHQRTLSEERARVGIPDHANGLPSKKIEDEEPKVIPYHKLPRIEQIKYHLREIYTEKCPEKLNKIDRLLERYETREEEFLTFVCEKYNVVINVPDPPEEEEDNDDDQDDDQDEGLDEDRGRSREVAASHSRESSRGNDRSRSASLNRLSSEEKDKESKHSSSVPPIKAAQRPEPPTGPKTGTRFGSRSLSPPAITRRNTTWKGGDDEELFKLEVLQQHVPDESDAWMQREMRILKSFTRIFPPEMRPPKSDDSNAAASGELMSRDEKEAADGSDNGEDSDDGDDRDEDDAETPSVPPPTKQSLPVANAVANLLTVPEKKKMATMNDILVEAFLQDRRQTLRLRGPLAHQARQEKDANSLPELNAKAAWGSTKAKASIGNHGWSRPPAKADTEKKKSDKPGPSQAEVANRLYKGLSSASPHNTASNILSNGSNLPEPSLADSVAVGCQLNTSGSVAEAVQPHESVYSSAPSNQQGIAFYGASNAPAAYNPNDSIVSQGTAVHHRQQYTHNQNGRYVKPTQQPRPGSLWGNNGNYVLDSSPNMTYIPAQFRGHSIVEQPSNRGGSTRAEITPAPLRQQVFQFNGGHVQPRPMPQNQQGGHREIQLANAGGLGILGSGHGNSSSEKYSRGVGGNSGRGSGRF